MLQLYNVKIREFKKSDINDVYQIELESFPNPYSKNLLMYYHEEFPDTFLVAEYLNRVIGFVIATIEYECIGHILSIAVKKEFRRKGIGSLLLGEVLNRLRKKGCKKVYLEVRVSNIPAIFLYKKFGFVCKGIIRKYYLNGEDAYLFEKELI